MSRHVSRDVSEWTGHPSRPLPSNLPIHREIWRRDDTCIAFAHRRSITFTMTTLHAIHGGALIEVTGSGLQRHEGTYREIEFEADRVNSIVSVCDAGGPGNHRVRNIRGLEGAEDEATRNHDAKGYRDGNQSSPILRFVAIRSVPGDAQSDTFRREREFGCQVAVSCNRTLDDIRVTRSSDNGISAPVATTRSMHYRLERKAGYASNVGLTIKRHNLNNVSTACAAATIRQYTDSDPRSRRRTEEKRATHEYLPGKGGEPMGEILSQMTHNKSAPSQSVQDSGLQSFRSLNGFRRTLEDTRLTEKSE
ncbi:hypothetical protein K474DRAFT_1697673 [Panus rudis PR-1116 ss-1]|nr:hypothetical protein K474DRAFT_1697673 [Panus rudis PR-1116 ss-1]